MKKLKLFVCAILVSLMGSATFGFFGQAGEAIVIDQPMTNDIHIAGENIQITAPISGDAYLAGDKIQILDNIEDDLIVAGRTITIDANIGDGIKVAGETVVISGHIAGDVMALAKNLQIHPGSTIGGDLIATASDVTIAGLIYGDTKIKSQKLNFGAKLEGDMSMSVDEIFVKTGSIQGKLDYKSKSPSEYLEKLVVSESINFTKIQKTKKSAFWSKYSFKHKLKDKILSALTMFVLSAILIFTLRKFFDQTVDNLQNSPGNSFLIGFLVYLFGWAGVFLLFVTVIGISLGVVWAFAYVMLFVFMGVINTSVYGAMLIDYFNKDRQASLSKPIQSGIVFLVALGFAFLPILDIFFAFFALGAILKTKLQFIKKYMV